MHERPLPLPPGRPADVVSATQDTTVMVDVVVLSGDVPLFEAIRLAVGERNPVWRARSAEESVDLLMTGRCGVLLIDMVAVSTRPTTLVQQIVEQFPDVVVVVAGRREDESVLAELISDGHVYRFMHKPLSPKRAGMFLNAAMRCHVERRGGQRREPLLPHQQERRSQVEPLKWLFVGSGLLLFMLLLGSFLVSRHPGATQESAIGTVAGPVAAPPSVPLADPVLSKARAALAAGRYESPPGRNALDLFAATLLTRPDDPEARAGLAATIAHLLEDAERARAGGDPAEARRLATRILAVDQANAGAQALLERLTAPPEPAAAPHTIESDSIAPVVAAPVATPVAAPRPATEPVAVAAAAAPPVRLPTPVTRLAAPVPAAQPSRTVTRPLRVQPDPLTPRVVGPGALPTSPAGSTRKPVARRYAAPEPPALPIAGYVSGPPEVVGGSTPLPVVELPVDAGVEARGLEPVDTPGPVYPPQAYRAGIEGWVEVDFTVGEHGTTRDIEVVAAEPRGVFDAAASAAVAAWTYRPRIVNGQAVAQRTTVTLHFNVED